MRFRRNNHPRIPEPVLVVPEAISKLFLRLEKKFVILEIIIVLAVGIPVVFGRTHKPETKTLIPNLQNQNYTNFVHSYNPRLTVSEVGLIVEETKMCAHESGIEQNIVLALIATESGFDPLAISNKWAVGLTQVNSRDWEDATFDIAGSIVVGCQKLIYYKTREHGHIVPTLFSYNSDRADGGSKGKGKKAVNSKVNFAKTILELSERISQGEATIMRGDLK